MELLTLNVCKAMDGSAVATIDVEADTTVDDFCKLVQVKGSLSASRMKLLEGIRVLPKDQTLKALGVVSGAQLSVAMESHLYIETSGETYLVLPGDGANFSSSYGWKGGVTSKTIWEKVRFDPETLQVHTGDFKYASVQVDRAGDRGGNDPNAAGILEVGPGKWTPYATCLDCSAPQSERATARIDLRGTPYKVPPDAFAHSGYLSAGTWTYSEDDQVVEIAGGGYCGWAAPKIAVQTGKVDDQPGGWFLQLMEV